MMRLLPQPLSAQLTALNPRERLLLGIGAAVLGVAIVVLGIWQPLRGSLAAEQARITRYDRMISDIADLPATKRTIAADPRPIATILAQTAEAQGLTVARLDTPTPDSATLTLQDAPFDTLILWIDGLNRDQGLVVVSATIRRTETPGTVSADLSLERAAP